MKLSTIQKRNNLNNVVALGEKGAGGAYHEYAVYKVEPETGANPTPQEVGHIVFQHGARNLPDSTAGVLDTDLLEIARHRLQCFQAGEFATREGALALTALEEALMWLNKRVEDRAERNVLGTNNK